MHCVLPLPGVLLLDVLSTWASEHPSSGCNQSVVSVPIQMVDFEFNQSLVFITIILQVRVQNLGSVLQLHHIAGF